MLVVAGKFDPAKTLGWINDIFGAIPKPTRKLTPTYTEEPAQDGERQVILRRTGGEQIEMMAYHIPAAGHPDLAAIEVLIELLGDRTSGRLHKALVETKKAVSAGADENMLHDPGYMLFTASLRKDGSLDDVEKTLPRRDRRRRERAAFERRSGPRPHAPAQQHRAGAQELLARGTRI